MKKAMILGASGQDGAYLASLLLRKGYHVVGVSRGTGPFPNLEELGVQSRLTMLQLNYSVLEEAIALLRREVPDEIYNFAGPSSVARSYQKPYDTFHELPVIVFTILEAIRDACPGVRFLNAGSAECFGVVEGMADETTPFCPLSPYGVAKAYTCHITSNYRSIYGLHASTAILFNHESRCRGQSFVTHKIAAGVAAFARDHSAVLRLGNLDVQRDWGHASDYVEGMWRMLQQDRADDYVLASGESHTIREFVVAAFSHIGRQVTWRGSGVDEVGADASTGDLMVAIDPIFFRPHDPPVFLGNPAKAERQLDWRRRVSFEQLVAEMVDDRISTPTM